MSHYKNKNVFLSFLGHIYLSYIPNKKDNFKQIIIKILFIISLISLIVSACFIADYFLEAEKQSSIIADSQNVWHSTEVQDNAKPQSLVTDILTGNNEDFKGWITISGTKIDNPIFQTTNNEFYLNHNQDKKKSAYGALYFDYRNEITQNKTDKNLVIYGHEMNNGSMFGSLKELRRLDFYKANPIIEFSTLYKSSKYKIYAIFVLNANKADDNGYIYNIYRKNFYNDNDFDLWTKEAIERSLINTGVDVKNGDNIITLVTCSKDFKNSRLVVMARETRDGENPTVNTSLAKINPNPRYPEIWYTERNIKN